MQCKYCSLFLRLICSGSPKISPLFRKTGFLGDFMVEISLHAFFKSSAGGQRREESMLSTQGAMWERFPAREIPHHLSEVMRKQVCSHPCLVFLLKRSHVGPHTVWTSNASMKLLFRIDHWVFPAWGATVLSQAQLPMPWGNSCPKQTPSST